ncbi:protein STRICTOSIDINE SYNTHASE-LIKE 6-like isoform X2 [Tasmannia lanceolata]|uniref:protein STRICTOSIDINE SYNTHASE-LIKE 6-like isoform X2 n=2 Tax=Tasmannia lanceolata TaxID=3420 RepID=UPI0040647BC5
MKTELLLTLSYNLAFLGCYKFPPRAENRESFATPTTTAAMGDGKISLWAGLLLLVVGPVVFAMFLFQLPAHNNLVLQAAERLGDGILLGPEDLAYDDEAQVLYTGCRDGWIKRVNIKESEPGLVENWVHVEGGRPLGLAFGSNKQLVVADAYKGLLRVSKEGVVEVLTKEADGVRFGLPNAVDVAGDGVIYFTDATYKYNLKNLRLDFLEGRPHGRLLSFDPSTNETRVLVGDLYFANGVALSPQQDFLVFCETPMARCRRYHIQGEKKGLVDNFVDNLPGSPDNIRYDGEGHFWIALVYGRTYVSNILLASRFVRKFMAMLGSISWIPNMQTNGGVLAVNLEGQILALYSDHGLTCTSGVKIRSHLYCGSIKRNYITRLDLTKHAARVT